MPKEFLVEIKRLKEKVKKANLPPDLKEKVEEMIERLVRVARLGGYSIEYERVSHYIDWTTALPWVKKTEDILNLEKAKEILDKNHHNLDDIKERILEYLAVLKLGKRKEKGGVLRAPILCLVGLVGTGKTTLGFSIAEAMGRQFARIPFGGMGSALDLRGQSRLHPEAEPGQIIKVLKRGGTKNPVILLDEIDRVAEGARSDIMGVLIELLDPEQNVAFTDYFIDYPFDLSEVLFVVTCNNTTNISTPVLDRMEPLQMPSYTDEEKITIGQDYVLPKVLDESGLAKENLKIDDDVWPKIVRPLGYDAGIRTLERTIEGICRKIAKLLVEKKGKYFHITTENIKTSITTEC